ncbi:BF3164 family lipoprotein [Roseivirga sp.]|uniref:BF3164 family lipoprotein n=1 Tax=Roseivirga sp. TaxID=1964215 RepID=UPI003B519AA7
MKRIFISLIIILLSGFLCNAQFSTVHWSDFPLKKGVQGKFWKATPGLADPTDLYFKDHFLIILDETNKNKFIKIIDTRTKKGFWMGSEGFGPGEIMSTQLIDKGFDNKSFWLYDFENSKYHRFSLQGKPSTALQTIDLEDHIPLNALWLDETNIIMMDWSIGKHVFRIMDFKSKKSYDIGDWKSLMKLDERIPVANQVQSHHGVLYINENRDLLALGALIVDYLLIYDDRTKSFKSIYGPQNHQLRYYKERPIAQRGFTGYMNVKVVNDEIYALYSGKYDKDLEDPTDAYNCNLILVYDRNGKPIEQLQLDHSIQCFDVDTETNTIYGLNFDQENPRIIEFKIN